MRNYSGTDKRDPDAIQKIDYFLRDVAAALGRVSNGESPVGSGASLSSVSSHHNLNDLTNFDDHSQYALLAGRDSGQLLYGIPSGMLAEFVFPGYLKLNNAGGFPATIGSLGTRTAQISVSGHSIQSVARIEADLIQFSSQNNSAGTVSVNGASSTWTLQGRVYFETGVTSYANLIIGYNTSVDAIGVRIQQNNTVTQTKDLLQFTTTGASPTILSRVDKDGKFFLIGDADARKPAFTVQDLASSSGGPTFDLQVVAGQAGAFSTAPGPCYLMPGTMLAKPTASDVNKLAQTANIASTKLCDAGGAILICAMMSCVATGTGIVSLGVQYSNEIGAINQRVCDLPMATAGATSVTTMALPIYVNVGDVHYTVSNYASGTYNLRIRAVGLGT